MASDIMSIQRQACMPWELWRGERLMIIRLNGEFGVSEQSAMRDAFQWVTGPVTIDLQNATLAANALGEIMLLANRIGLQNVRLVNPTVIMRKILSLTHLDRVLSVSGDFTRMYDKSA
jgi:anti-anti-sigma regulatory factor